MSRALNPGLLGLLLLLIVGTGLRLYHREGYLAKYPLLAADAVEYKAVGDFLVGRSAVEPVADRPPGFPLLLGLLYAIAAPAGSEAALQAALGPVFDAVLVVLLWALVRSLWGEWPALGAALLVALNAELVRCSALSGSEQFYAALAIAVVTTYLRLGAGAGWPWLALAAGLGAWLVVTKQEGGLLLLVLGAFHLVGCRRQGRAWSSVAAEAAILLLPPLAAYGGYRYYSAEILGIATMDLRTGNALFHAEFLAGRLPWGYMRDLRTEYFQISNSDWLLGFHTPLQILGIIARSSLQVGGMLVDLAGGPVWALIGASGFAVAAGQPRWRWLAVLFAASVAPFCLLAEAHARSSYTPRLLVPTVPILAMGVALGIAQGMQRLGPWIGGQRWRAPALGTLLVGMFVFWQYGGGARLGEHPASFAHDDASVDAEAAAPAEDLDLLISRGMFKQMAGEHAEAKQLFEQVLDRAPQYGSARVGLALLALAGGDTALAEDHLRRSLSAVPYFAEASALLAAVQLRQERWDEALATCQQCVEHRPDYPPCQLLLANLLLDRRRDYRGAADHYQQFIHLNRQAHANQLVLLRRKLAANPGDAGLAEVVAEVERILATDESGRVTAASWHYLNRGKAGALCGRVKPADGGIYHWLGLAQEGTGEVEAAIRSYERSIGIGELVGSSRQRLAALREGRREDLPTLGPTIYQADALLSLALSGYFDRQYAAVHTKEGRP